MAHWIIDCSSGIRALVAAPTAEAAQRDWDAATAAGEAEPGKARRPQPGEVRAVARGGVHDYR